MTNVHPGSAQALIYRSLGIFFSISCQCADLSNPSDPQDASVRCEETVRRVALVIGNSDYEKGTFNPKALDHLDTPKNDAVAIAEKLHHVGFEDENIVLRLNVTTETIAQVMSDFHDRLTACSVAVFFYSGHGFSVNGDDFFPAVNAKIKTQFDVQQTSLSLSRVMALMDEAGAQTKIVFLDACRENPYSVVQTKGLSSGGLIPLETPAGSEIIYATQPKNVALSIKTEKYSIFTGALLNYISKPDMSLDSMVKKVMNDVKAKTGGTQIPYRSGDLSDDFFFIRLQAAAVNQTSATPQATYPAPPPSVRPSSNLRASLRVAAIPDTVGIKVDGFAAVDYKFSELRGVDVQIESEDSQFFYDSGEPIGTKSSGGRILSGSFQVDGGHEGTYHNNIYLPLDVANAARAHGSTSVQLRHVFNCRDVNGNMLKIPAILKIVMQ